MQESYNIEKILLAIQSYKTVKCDMRHEQVLTDANKNPIHSLQDNTIVFNRVSLCDIKYRKWQLGCAHSPVNINFERELDHLAHVLPQHKTQIETYKSEFKAVVVNIYTLDHKVGNIEHELALCALASGKQKTKALMITMDDLKSEHRRLLDSLSKIKSEIELFIKEHVN